MKANVIHGKHKLIGVFLQTTCFYKTFNIFSNSKAERAIRAKKNQASSTICVNLARFLGGYGYCINKYANIMPVHSDFLFSGPCC